MMVEEEVLQSLGAAEEGRRLQLRWQRAWNPFALKKYLILASSFC